MNGEKQQENFILCEFDKLLPVSAQHLKIIRFSFPKIKKEDEASTQNNVVQTKNFSKPEVAEALKENQL